MVLPPQDFYSIFMTSKSENVMCQSKELIHKNCVYIYMLSLSRIQLFEFVRSLLHSLTPSSRIATMRYMGFLTGGIRARVETLRPIGLKMFPHILF